MKRAEGPITGPSKIRWGNRRPVTFAKAANIWSPSM